MSGASCSWPPRRGWPGLRERVVVIDRQTKDIIWQYGATDQKGHALGCLNYPDGFDVDVFRDGKAALGPRP
jgi:hypothetical protein